MRIRFWRDVAVINICRTLRSRQFDCCEIWKTGSKRFWWIWIAWLLGKEMADGTQEMMAPWFAGRGHSIVVSNNNKQVKQAVEKFEIDYITGRWNPSLDDRALKLSFEKWSSHNWATLMTDIHRADFVEFWSSHWSSTTLSRPRSWRERRIENRTKIRSIQYKKEFKHGRTSHRLCGTIQTEDRVN